MEAAYENCLVLGDSFIKRLHEYYCNRFHRGYFWVHGAPVNVWGRSGAVISDVGADAIDVASGYYSVVVLAFGSNDLCNGCTPDHVADDLIQMAYFLLRFRSVSRVVIFPLLRRTTANIHFRITLQEFNCRVHHVNDILKARCTGGNAVFWKHDHRVQRKIADDGTHLNSIGMKHFHDSVYRALWSQLQIVLRIVQT